MKTIVFFNNRSGVGKTSLVYHLAWMFSELEYRVIVADLDPQTTLSSMFLDDERLEELWEGKGGHTTEENIASLFCGTEDIGDQPHIEKIEERIGLLAGNLSLSKWEGEFSTQWPKCLAGDKRAFRVMTAFSRLINRARDSFDADIALVDVGPNLGAINRAALLASDHIVIPLAPDLFSLQGLRNVGSTLQEWQRIWQQCKDTKPDDIELPSGKMEPVGYIIMRRSVRLAGPVRAYSRWIEKIPDTYRQLIIEKCTALKNNGEHCLAQFKDYHALMPMAQEARKPMFMLKPADGAVGAYQSAVVECYRDFRELARKIH